MVVCDGCKAEKNIHDGSIVVQKTPKGKPGRPRKIIEIPHVLCEACLDILLRNLGILKKSGVLLSKTLKGIEHTYTGSAWNPSDKESQPNKPQIRPLVVDQVDLVS